MMTKLRIVGQNNRVSVIIPTYNRGKFLLKAIKAILVQTHPVSEVLVCDDGSTDNSKEVVSKIHDKKVIWVHGFHTGLPAVPRNHGLKKASGDWIAMLDSDDQWLSEKLEKQLNFAIKSGYKAVCTNGYRVADQKRQETMINLSRDVITFPDLLRTNYIICSSVIFHRSLLEKVHGFPENGYLKSIEDFALWLRIASITPFGYLDSPLVFYRSQPEDSIRRSAFYTNFGQQLTSALSNFLPWYLRYKIGL